MLAMCTWLRVRVDGSQHSFSSELTRVFSVMAVAFFSSDFSSPSVLCLFLTHSSPPSSHSLLSLLFSLFPLPSLPFSLHCPPPLVPLSLPFSLPSSPPPFLPPPSSSPSSSRVLWQALDHKPTSGSLHKVLTKRKYIFGFKTLTVYVRSCELSKLLMDSF